MSRHFSGIKRSLSRTATDFDSFTYRVLIGRVSIFEHKQNAENVAHSLSIHRDRRCTDVYVRIPRHLTLDGEAFHCAVGHAFLRMPDWYAEVSSGMQRHPIFADRSRLRPREFRLLHTASRTAPAGFKSAPWATASKSDTWFYSLRPLFLPLPPFLRRIEGIREESEFIPRLQRVPSALRSTNITTIEWNCEGGGFFF